LHVADGDRDAHCHTDRSTDRNADDGPDTSHSHGNG
jgi:hypothetical protein